jgi:mannose-6-phosphate isomerase
MMEIPLYPLRFEPIYQYRLWGGRRLADLLSAPLPGNGPIGEAWILSDRNDHPSLVADGPLKGRSIRQLLERSPEQMLGKLASHYTRFPLLLKFLDVTKGLSVQVHPSDALKELIPVGDTGKTEAWVVLEKGADARIYAGLNPGTTADVMREAIDRGTLPDHLASFAPEPGECVLIRAGTVHSLRDVVVFEVQENSDVTFRLFDWNHIDPSTHQPRPLQVDQAMACINFTQGSIQPVTPQVRHRDPVHREKLLRCDHFGVCRVMGEFPFTTGASDTCRIVVCLDGEGELERGGIPYRFDKGDVMLLPAVVGACLCRPNGTVTLLEIALPEIVNP